MAQEEQIAFQWKILGKSLQILGKVQKQCNSRLKSEKGISQRRFWGHHKEKTRAKKALKSGSQFYS